MNCMKDNGSEKKIENEKDSYKTNGNQEKSNKTNVNQKECNKAIWEMSAHLLAQAVKRRYNDVKLGIGSSIEEGFYYDFDREGYFHQEELAEIEQEMYKIMKENNEVKRFTLSRNNAIKYMDEKGEPYKVELIKEIAEGEEVSFYQQGEFVDLSSGPQVDDMNKIKAIKLISIAGAYWKGNEKNKMLSRIYGISFSMAEDLEEYLSRIEEAKKRDHRKLGKELGLFALMDEGPGFPFFLPKGLILKNILIDYWRQLHQREGYQEISTPIILQKQLWETSGHWQHYRENMYTTVIEGDEYAIKPMNCPGGMLYYKSSSHSYREFPLKVGELGLVHRNEKSGTLHGLIRVRYFTQDDAHIFMMEDQITQVIGEVIKLIDEVYQMFGFEYHVELSTKPENSIGTEEEWELATNGLMEALDGLHMNYVINEGDGAFYGPKIDFHLKDSIGRTWQCGTIQLDFQLPRRFELEYIGADGEKHRPIMIHRVLFGSIERFIGILIEHYGGKFPLWLAPVQVKILQVSQKVGEYCNIVLQELKKKGIRCELDDKDEKIGYKIRNAQLEKVPYMLILGSKEEDNNVISVRSREEGDKGEMILQDFIDNFLLANLK